MADGQSLQSGVWDDLQSSHDLLSAIEHRAGDGIRTRDLLLGKETYYHCTTPAGTILFSACPASARTWVIISESGVLSKIGAAFSFQWTRPDSNRRSSPCKGDAFPLGHGPDTSIVLSGALFTKSRGAALFGDDQGRILRLSRPTCGPALLRTPWGCRPGAPGRRAHRRRWGLVQRAGSRRPG
jgi:hypothetical protein